MCSSPCISHQRRQILKRLQVRDSCNHVAGRYFANDRYRQVEKLCSEFVPGRRAAWRPLNLVHAAAKHAAVLAGNLDGNRPLPREPSRHGGIFTHCDPASQFVYAGVAKPLRSELPQSHFPIRQRGGQAVRYGQMRIDVVAVHCRVLATCELCGGLVRSNGYGIDILRRRKAAGELLEQDLHGTDDEKADRVRLESQLPCRPLLAQTFNDRLEIRIPPPEDVERRMEAWRFSFQG